MCFFNPIVLSVLLLFAAVIVYNAMFLMGWRSFDRIRSRAFIFCGLLYLLGRKKKKSHIVMPTFFLFLFLSFYFPPNLILVFSVLDISNFFVLVICFGCDLVYDHGYVFVAGQVISDSNPNCD